MSKLHQETIALCWGFSRALRLLNLANQKLKCPANILVVSCARLCPAALELLGKLLALFGADLALLWSKIALVTYDDDGNGFGTLRVNFKAYVSAMVLLGMDGLRGKGWEGFALDD